MKAKISPFSGMSSVRGMLAPRGIRYPSDWLIPMARGTPANTPSTARIRLSLRSCRASRAWPAPNAIRTLNSFRRAMERASSRLDTLAHTIRKTRPHTAIRIASGPAMVT